MCLSCRIETLPGVSFSSLCLSKLFFGDIGVLLPRKGILVLSLVSPVFLVFLLSLIHI